jgi:hypothetical protein
MKLNNKQNYFILFLLLGILLTGILIFILTKEEGLNNNEPLRRESSDNGDKGGLRGDAPLGDDYTPDVGADWNGVGGNWTGNASEWVAPNGYSVWQNNGTNPQNMGTIVHPNNDTVSKGNNKHQGKNKHQGNKKNQGNKQQNNYASDYEKQNICQKGNSGIFAAEYCK